MASDKVVEANLLQAVRTLATGLNSMVQDGRQAFESSGRDINDFVISHGPDELHGLMGIYPVSLYVDCLRTVGVNTRKELESLWASFYSDMTVRECVEELLVAEDSWISFVAELDQQMKDYEEKTALTTVNLGDCIPLDITLIETKSNETLSLKSCVERSPFTLFILRKHYV